MARTDTLLERMKRTQPLPLPESGPRLALLRLAAAALGEPIIATLPDGTVVPGHEQQMSNAIAQLNVGATLQRVDADPTNWDESTSAGWLFKPILTGGEKAGSLGLELWGRQLETPRHPLEANDNDAYRLRIISEAVAPSTTNIGMGKIIDSLIQQDGTRVVEAEGFFGNLRLDDGHRLDEGQRFMGLSAFGAETLWNCFVVITPGPLGDDAEQQAVMALCDKKKAAGQRILAILYDGRIPAVDLARYVAPGTLVQARVTNAEEGATYTWSVVGGTLVSGQGTPTPTVSPSANGTMTLTVTQTGGIGDGKSASRSAYIVAGPQAAITVDVTEAPAGEDGHTASVPPEADTTYAWEIEGGYLLAGQGTASIRFAVGEANETAGAQATITCRATSRITGLQTVGTAQVDIIPFPRTTQFTTGTLASGAYALGSLPMRPRLAVTGMAVTGSSRIRLYATAAQRDADLTRPSGADPVGNHGLIAEGNFDAAASILSATWRPKLEGENGDTPQTGAIYYSARNTDANAASLTITINYVQEP